MEARDRSKPFFAFVPFNAVHGPNEAPEELIEKYAPLVEKVEGLINDWHSSGKKLWGEVYRS